MKTLIGNLLDSLFKKNKKEREEIIFYFKSLLLLILIVCFLSNKMWNMNDSIKNLLSTKAITFITESSKIGIHFFTCLAILLCVLVFIAAILRLLAGKFFTSYEDYFNRMRIGMENCLCNSAENVLLFFMIEYILGENVLQSYIAIYSNVVFAILGIIGIYQFFTSSIWGIINRFFVLKSYDEEEK